MSIEQWRKPPKKPFGEEIRTGTPDSILAGMFRSILNTLGITTSRFNVLVEKYIDRAQIPRNLKAVSQLRGNLNKELMKSEMTWKVFIKGLTFINIKRFEIAIRLHHANGTITSHVQEVFLDTGVDIDGTDTGPGSETDS